MSNNELKPPFFFYNYFNEVDFETNMCQCNNRINPIGPRQDRPTFDKHYLLAGPKSSQAVGGLAGSRYYSPGIQMNP